MADSNLTVIRLNEPAITDFAAARNRALSQARTDWVLFLDTDEELTPQLQKEIEAAIQDDSVVAYRLRRQDHFLGRVLKYGENSQIRLLRLARKDAGLFRRPVHEFWEVKGRVGELRSPLIHRPHPDISSFLRKIDHYSTLEAEYRYAQHLRPGLWRILVYPVAKFVRNYLWLQGFRDGIPGMIMAVLMSFHSYLTWTKLYLLWQRR